MTNQSAAQTVQSLLTSEQHLLARRGATQEALQGIETELSQVRAAIRGIQLGQQLAAETAAQAAPEVTPEAP